MNTLSLNEFSQLNKNEKIKIFEKIQNSIEMQKQYYYNQHKDDIPIRFYYPQENDSNFQSIKNHNENGKNDYHNYQNKNILSASISSNDSYENKKIKNLINKAKKNVLEVKKEMEKLKNINYETKNNELNNEETIQEINYMIESTTNSYDSTIKEEKNKINNYTENTLIVNGNYNHKYNKNKNKNQENNHINFGDLYQNEIKNILYNTNLNNNSLKREINEYNSIKNYSKSENNFINKNNSSKNKKAEKNRIKNKKNLLSLYSDKKISNTINTNNCSMKKNDKLKLDLKEKFGKEYFYNKEMNNPYLFDIYQNNSTKNDKQSRNKNKRYKSFSNKTKTNPQDISNKLYNMQKIIIDKINKKKQELEELEMINCTFIPKINYNSKKIMKKLEKRKEEYINNQKKQSEKIFERISDKNQIIDLIPRSNKSFNAINLYKDEFYNSNKEENIENNELKQCIFKPKINKNKSFNNNRNNNINFKYNTIDTPREKNIYKELNVKNGNKRDNMNKQFNKPTNIKQTFLKNNQKQNKIDNNLKNSKLNLNIENERKNNHKQKIENYYNSKYNYNKPEKNEYYKYIDSINVNKTESNNNYLSAYDSICDNSLSKQESRIINSKSFKKYNNINNNYVYKNNSYKNENENYINNLYNINNQYNYENNKEYIKQNKIYFSNNYIPNRQLRNTNNIKEIQIGNLTTKNNNNIYYKDNFGPIKLKENLEIEQKIEKDIERNSNNNIYRKGKIMTINNYSSIPKPHEKLSYQNNNKGVYIKKNIKNFSRNYSYTHRNNKYNINDNYNGEYNDNFNDKIINNRMIIEKLLLEEE